MPEHELAVTHPTLHCSDMVLGGLPHNPSDPQSTSTVSAKYLLTFFDCAPCHCELAANNDETRRGAGGANGFTTTSIVPQRRGTRDGTAGGRNRVAPGPGVWGVCMGTAQSCCRPTLTHPIVLLALLRLGLAPAPSVPTPLGLCTLNFTAPLHLPVLCILSHGLYLPGPPQHHISAPTLLAFPHLLAFPRLLAFLSHNSTADPCPPIASLSHADSQMVSRSGSMMGAAGSFATSAASVTRCDFIERARMVDYAQ